MKPKTVFLDRDGVINETFMRDGKWSSPRSLAELRFVPAAKAALQDLASAGYFLVVVTNQPDLARKKLMPEVLESIHGAMTEWLGGEKVIRDIQVCPHLAEDNCSCRKPKPGLLLQAARKWGIELEESFIIGDRDVDMLAGAEVRSKTVLIDQPYNQGVPADYRAKDIADACRWIKTYRGKS